MDHLNQLGGVGIQVDHVARFLRRLGAGVHGHRHVGLSQRGRVVGAVAGHRHQPTFRLVLADQRQLGFRRRFGEEIIDAGLGGDRRGGQAVIAGDHHRFNAHFAQLGETFFDAAFDDIFERNNPQHLFAFGDHQRRGPLAGDLFHLLIDIDREVAAVGLHVAANGVHRPFADHALIDIDAAHPRLRGKGDKGGVQRLQIAFAQVKALFRQHHDAAPLRGFIRQRGELGGVGEGSLFHAARRQEGGGLAVAEGNGPGFIQQQDIDVACGFHRAAAGGDHVGAEHTTHPGDADGRQQPADGGRDQAHQQGDQYGNADRIAAPRREGPDGGGGQQEHQRQGDQQDRQGDLVRRFTALGAFHHGDHPVEEGFSRVHAAADHQPVGENACPAGHRGKIATGFTDHRGRLAGNGAFVHRGAAFDDFAIAGDNIPGFHQHHVAFAQIFRRHVVDRRVMLRGAQFAGEGRFFHPFQAVGLGFAAAFRHRFGKVGEQHGKPQPDTDGGGKGGATGQGAASHGDRQQGG